MYLYIYKYIYILCPKLTWHLKIDPWKRGFRTWKPSFSGSMLVFGRKNICLERSFIEGISLSVARSFRPVEYANLRDEMLEIDVTFKQRRVGEIDSSLGRWPWNGYTQLSLRSKRHSAMIQASGWSSRSRRFAEVTCARFGDANFVLKNTKISRSGYLPFFHHMLRLPRKVTLQQHQLLRLPGKVTPKHHSNFTKYCAAPATKSRPAVVVVMWLCGLVRCGDVRWDVLREMWWCAVRCGGAETLELRSCSTNH